MRDGSFAPRLRTVPALADGLEATERELARVLCSGNDHLDHPAQRIVHASGKRLRPLLTIACAMSGGARLSDDIVSGAVAVELVHAGSLIHDDILDASPERRGVPTVNEQEGLAVALLVGDSLLARSGEVASRVSREVAAVLSTTIVQLADGQSRESLDAFRSDRSLESYRASISGKTASLIRAACVIGGLCARSPLYQVEMLAEFGYAFGMAFQIIDDVLDIVSSTEELAKPAGNDIREGVFTLPILLALRGPNGDALRDMLPVKLGDDSDTAAIHRIVQESGSVQDALKEAEQYNDEAARALAPLPPHPVGELLFRLPADYLAWVQERCGSSTIEATALEDLGGHR